MSDDAQRWKEKYLQSIEQQDTLEKRWNARLDLLRRGLVRSSLAAEGADKAVDACMKEMREIVRKDDMDAGLSALIPKLEKAVLDSEQRREQRVEQMGTALTSLVSQLQSLPLPREVLKPLKRFSKNLEDRVNQARELPLLLSELSSLQAQALSQLEHTDEAARPGLLQRLFGGRDSAESADASVAQAVADDATPPKAAPGVDGPDDALPAPAPVPSQQAQWTHEAPEEVKPVSAADAPPVAAALSADNGPANEAPAPVVVEDTLPLADVRAPQPSTVHAPDTTVANEPVVEPIKLATQESVGESALQASASPVSADAIEDAGSPASIGVTPADAALDPERQAIAPTAIHGVNSVELNAAATVNTGNADDLKTAEADQVPATDESAPEAIHAEEEGTYALPSSPEPSYSSVAVHIEETLLGLLDELTLPEHHRPQAEAMRLRLEHGLNWYELLPILDDLAVLMLAITDSGQQEFELYLKQLNERLASFQANLLAASDDHAGQQSASRELNDQLREHVGDLQTRVHDAEDLNTLKHVLETRLEDLLGTMDAHQQQRDQREQEVAASLQSLASRVATMEQEATGFRAHLEEQRQKALIDTLTGLPNRAAWNERLDAEIGKLHKQRSSLLLGILDLDHFKRINDGYGHLAGDKVLKIVATQLKKHLRPSDFLARFGGEEFVILLPDARMEDGVSLLERLRVAVEQCPFHFKGEPVTITVSMGITTFKPAERSDLVLKRADEALYRAKHQGRNRIEQG